MTPGTVLRLTATAALDDARPRVQEARAYAGAGDPDYAWLVARWERGQMLVGRVRLSAYVVGRDGEVDRLHCDNRGVWLEVGAPPLVERQVSEIAPKDMPELARGLADRGLAVPIDELDRMFIHVELDEPLRAALDGDRTRDAAKGVQAM